MTARLDYLHQCGLFALLPIRQIIHFRDYHLDISNSILSNHKRLDQSITDMAGKLSIDPFKGIIVQIISKGTVLDLYNDPDLSEEDDPYASQKYIEVTAGSTFQVKVLLTSDFQLYNIQPRDTVCVTLGIDGSDVFRTAKQESRRTIERYATSGRPTTFEFSNFDHFSEAGEWIRSDYSFGNLNLRKSN